MAHIVGIRGDIVQGFQGDPIRRIYVIFGVCTGVPPILGNCHICDSFILRASR